MAELFQRRGNADAERLAQIIEELRARAPQGRPVAEISQGGYTPPNRRDGMFVPDEYKGGIESDFGFDDLVTSIAPAGKAVLAAAPIVGKVMREAPAVEGAIARRAAKAGETALDMSHAARMKRAEEMGFQGEGLYHATLGNFTEFSPGKAGRNFENPAKAFFFTDNPNAAGSFLDRTKGESWGGVTIPKEGTLAERLERVRHEVRSKNLTHTKLTGDDAIFGVEAKNEGLSAADSALVDEYFSLQKREQALSYDEWRGMHDEMDTEPGANIIKARLRYENPKTINLSNERGDVSLHGMIEEAKSEGHDAVIFHNAADNPGKSAYGKHQYGKTVVVFSPEQIRSVNAAFDPKKKKSGNILAGAAAAAGAGIAAQDDDNSMSRRLRRGY